MTSSEVRTARFRSATEFPKTIQELSLSEADLIYQEMRDCLIFSNRSRSQLVRRNRENKEKVLQLQTIIHQLNQKVQQRNSKDQEVFSELVGSELATMTSRLDALALAFEEVADIDSPMSVMAMPSRFSRFWKALKDLILWWKEEQQDESLDVLPIQSNPILNSEEDRRNNPQMYTDPASVQRSLRDE